MCCLTWLTQVPKITTFVKITDVLKLHGHEGKTDVIIEGKKKDRNAFEECKTLARRKKTMNKNTEPTNG
jgi:hypothetical protein